ncbi:hypothetical protein CYMTET_36511, partial [Cymbomonas tetramitiformis]
AQLSAGSNAMWSSSPVKKPGYVGAEQSGPWPDIKMAGRRFDPDEDVVRSLRSQIEAMEMRDNAATPRSQQGRRLPPRHSFSNVVSMVVPASPTAALTSTAMMRMDDANQKIITALETQTKSLFSRNAELKEENTKLYKNIARMKFSAALKVTSNSNPFIKKVEQLEVKQMALQAELEAQYTLREAMQTQNEALQAQAK